MREQRVDDALHVRRRGHRPRLVVHEFQHQARLRLRRGTARRVGERRDDVGTQAPAVAVARREARLHLWRPKRRGAARPGTLRRPQLRPRRVRLEPEAERGKRLPRQRKRGRRRSRLDAHAPGAGGTVPVDEVVVAAPAVHVAAAAAEGTERVDDRARRRERPGLDAAVHERRAGGRAGVHERQRRARRRRPRAAAAAAAAAVVVVVVAVIVRPESGDELLVRHEPVPGDVDLPRELHHLRRRDVHPQPREPAVEAFVRQPPQLLAVERAERVEQPHLIPPQRGSDARGRRARREERELVRGRERARERRRLPRHVDASTHGADAFEKFRAAFARRLLQRAQQQTHLVVLEVNLGVHEPEALRRGRGLEQLRGAVARGGFEKGAAAAGARESKPHLRLLKRHELSVAAAFQTLSLRRVHRRAQRLRLRERQRDVVSPFLEAVYVEVSNRVLEVFERDARVRAARGSFRDSSRELRESLLVAADVRVRGPQNLHELALVEAAQSGVVEQHERGLQAGFLVRRQLPRRPIFLPLGLHQPFREIRRVVVEFLQRVLLHLFRVHGDFVVDVRARRVRDPVHDDDQVLQPSMRVQRPPGFKIILREVHVIRKRERLCRLVRDAAIQLELGERVEPLRVRLRLVTQRVHSPPNLRLVVAAVLELLELLRVLLFLLLFLLLLLLLLLLFLLLLLLLDLLAVERALAVADAADAAFRVIVLRRRALVRVRRFPRAREEIYEIRGAGAGAGAGARAAAELRAQRRRRLLRRGDVAQDVLQRPRRFRVVDQQRGVLADREREALRRERPFRHGVRDDVRDALAKDVQKFLRVLRVASAAKRAHAEPQQVSVRVLPPYVRRALLREQPRLNVLRAHAVHDEPREHVPQLSSRALRRAHLGRIRRARARRAPLPRRRRGLDELLHLGDDEQLETLPAADLSHAPRALGVISQRHVLPERQRRARGRGLLDVHPRRVHLVVKRKSLALVQRGDARERGDRPAFAHQYHLTIALEEPRDGEVGEVRDERAGVHERVNRRVRGGDRSKQRQDVPPRGDFPRGDDVVVGQRREDFRVRAELELWGAELQGE
eukprot:31178-Pelagococcus_subviridis.AAC.13